MRPVRLGFTRVTTLANPERLFEAIPALRGCIPIRSMTYPVYASPLLFACSLSSHRSHRSARGATLGNGGWLTLSMPGLSPGQMRRALRGALTLGLSRRLERQRKPVGLSPWLYFPDFLMGNLGHFFCMLYNQIGSPFIGFVHHRRQGISFLFKSFYFFPMRFVAQFFVHFPIYKY